MGEPPDRIEDTIPTKVGVALVKRVVQHQSRFWRCLYPKDVNKGWSKLRDSLRIAHLMYLDIEVIPGAERMHGMISYLSTYCG